MKKIICVTFLLSLLGCSNVSMMDKQSLQGIKSIAVVGYTMDFRLYAKNALLNGLLGGEKKMGMGGKIENDIVETQVSAQGYSAILKGLRHNSWTVVDATQQKSALIEEIYKAPVKVGYLPLKGGHERFEKSRVPQHHYMGGILMQEPDKIRAIAQQLNVDAVATVYVTTRLSNSFSIGPIGLGTYKYNSTLLIDIYDRKLKKIVLKLAVTGDGIKEQTLDSESPDANYVANTVAGLEKASQKLTEELKNLF